MISINDDVNIKYYCSSNRSEINITKDGKVIVSLDTIITNNKNYHKPIIHVDIPYKDIHLK